MEHIVVCYNLAILQMNNHLPQLTLGLLYTFYGIRMYMSIFKRDEAQHFWSDEVCGDLFAPLPNLGKYMSYKKYKEIKANLRFDDYTKWSAEARDKDNAWKVRWLFNFVKDKCRQGMPCPGQWISIDEAMVKYYGRRCPISKSMPQKPIKRGFLFYCAVCYLTKWVFDIDLSDGNLKADDFSHQIVD